MYKISFTVKKPTAAERYSVAFRNIQTPANNVEAPRPESFVQGKVIRVIIFVKIAKLLLTKADRSKPKPINKNRE